MCTSDLQMHISALQKCINPTYRLTVGSTGSTDLRYNGPTAAKKQLENHVQVGQKCNIEDMRRAKNTPPVWLVH